MIYSLLNLIIILTPQRYVLFRHKPIFSNPFYIFVSLNYTREEMQMKLLIIYTILFFIPTLSLGQRAKIAFEKTTCWSNTSKPRVVASLPNGSGNPYFPGTVAPSPSRSTRKTAPVCSRKKLSCTRMPHPRTSCCAWKERSLPLRSTSRQPTPLRSVTYVSPRTRST